MRIGHKEVDVTSKRCVGRGLEAVESARALKLFYPLRPTSILFLPILTPISRGWKLPEVSDYDIHITGSSKESFTAFGISPSIPNSDFRCSLQHGGNMLLS